MNNHTLGPAAWRALTSGQHTRWETDTDRLSTAPILVHHTPKFKLSADDTYFCIGSCFARNIEEHLIYRHRRVLSKRILSPQAEWGARTNGFMNKFTTQSMLNEVLWALNHPILDATLFEEAADGWIDPQLCTGMPPVTLERALERRAYLIDDYFQRLRVSSVVILTLGLSEVWLDTRSGLYLNAAPSYHAVRREPDRYQCVFTQTADHTAALAQMRDALKQLNPAIRIIVTVSPVPLSQTFSGRDVAVANTRSKAVLRAAAEQFADGHDDVDYFPSYDMVALAPRQIAYGPDCLHVSNAVVGAIMGHFLRLYADIDTPAPDFIELAYLAANPDVEADVRLGILESGFQHWCEAGQREGRKRGPDGGPTPLMVMNGAV